HQPPMSSARELRAPNVHCRKRTCVCTSSTEASRSRPTLSKVAGTETRLLFLIRVTCLNTATGKTSALSGFHAQLARGWTCSKTKFSPILGHKICGRKTRSPLTYGTAIACDARWKRAITHEIPSTRHSHLGTCQLILMRRWGQWVK